VRELGLPREALLNVIVRGEQAIPPRGSSRVEAGDQLHVLVRQEVAVEFRRKLEQLAHGPDRVHRRKAVTRGSTVFSTRRGVTRTAIRRGPRRSATSRSSSSCARGATSRRRRRAGGRRYAFTGPVIAVGSATQVQDAARRRLRIARDDADEAWWREVIGALAVP
jgi:cell volume regulation protein A